MNFRRPSAGLLVALALASSAASAQTTNADKATARALAIEGHDALEKKDFVTAADRFARADALYHVPSLALSLAQAQVALGKLVDAQETYTRIVREGVPPKSPPGFVKAVKDATVELEALRPRIPSVTILVNGPTAPVVTFDGAAVPAAALGVKRPVDPGKHVVNASASGFVTREATVSIAEGKSETVTLTLDPVAVPLPPKPPVPPPVPAIKPPPVVPVKPPPPPATSSLRILGVAALGLGGAGLVLGAATGVVAMGKIEALKKACPSGTCPPSDQPDIDSYHLMGNLSTAGFVVGIAGGAAGATLLLLAPKSASASAKPRKDASIEPLVGLGFVGARGSF